MFRERFQFECWKIGQATSCNLEEYIISRESRVYMAKCHVGHAEIRSTVMQISNVVDGMVHLEYFYFNFGYASFGAYSYNNVQYYNRSQIHIYGESITV